MNKVLMEVDPKDLWKLVLEQRYPDGFEEERSINRNDR